MKVGSVINIIGVQCPPDAEARFDKWYNEKHIPDMLKSREVIRVTRYKIASATGADRWQITGAESGYPKYIAIYEFKDREAFEAWDRDPELRPGREEAKAVTQETGAELFWRVQYEAIKTWER